MVKREFIDKEQVITEIKYMDNNGFITRSVNHVCEDIRMIPTITEQEIVKPYFEKLTTKIQQLRGCSCSNSDGVIDDIEDIIDNLLSEQEG